MLCPLCKIEMRINGTRHVVVNDNTPDKETELYLEQDLVCRNKKCSNYGKVVEKIRSRIELTSQS
jgi:hypothetical protein